MIAPCKDLNSTHHEVHRNRTDGSTWAGKGRTFLRTFMVTLLSGMAPGSPLTSLQRTLVRRSSRAQGRRAGVAVPCIIPSNSSDFSSNTLARHNVSLAIRTCISPVGCAAVLLGVCVGGKQATVTYRQRPRRPLQKRPFWGLGAPTDHCPSRRSWR